MMFKRIAVLAALAAGTVLLTACNATESVSGARQGGTVADVKLASSEGDSVDCGEVDVAGGTHTLVAEPAADGIVGCTEAFNVLDEYLTHGTSIEDTPLSDGWSCTTDDGETASIGCAKDHTGLAFSTRPV